MAGDWSKGWIDWRTNKISGNSRKKDRKKETNQRARRRKKRERGKYHVFLHLIQLINGARVYSITKLYLVLLHLLTRMLLSITFSLCRTYTPLHATKNLSSDITWFKTDFVKSFVPQQPLDSNLWVQTFAKKIEVSLSHHNII